MDTSQAQYEKQRKAIKNEVYVIHIPSVSKCLEDGEKNVTSPQLKKGTICKEIYNEQCLFCSNQY